VLSTKTERTDHSEALEVLQNTDRVHTEAVQIRSAATRNSLEADFLLLRKWADQITIENGICRPTGSMDCYGASAMRHVCSCVDSETEHTHAHMLTDGFQMINYCRSTRISLHMNLSIRLRAIDVGTLFALAGLGR